MPYNVNKTNGDLLVVVEDGTVDVNSVSLTLLGKNYPGYGEFINENFVHLLENFSSTTQPDAPIEGQLWYDTANKVVKVYNGSTFGSVGTSVQLDVTSTNVHFPLFVASETGGENFKIARNKSISIQPSTGNVAINKQSAGICKLEINGGTLTRTGLPANPISPGLVVHIHGPDGGGSAGIGIDHYSGGAVQAVGAGVLTRASRGTSASKLALQNDDFISFFNGRGWDGTDYTDNVGAFIIRASQNWTSTAHGTKLEFYTTNNGQSGHSRKVVIDHNGDLSTVGDIIAFNTSDITLKTDIQKITGALEKVCQLDGIRFSWLENTGKGLDQPAVGVIAQQVQDVLPEAVKTKETGFLGVDYTQLVPLLIEAIKDLKTQIEDLKKPNLG